MIRSTELFYVFFYSTDEYSKDAIKLLIDAGLKFDQHAKKGIPSLQFAEYLIGSGNHHLVVFEL